MADDQAGRDARKAPAPGRSRGADAEGGHQGGVAEVQREDARARRGAHGGELADGASHQAVVRGEHSGRQVGGDLAVAPSYLVDR